MTKPSTVVAQPLHDRVAIITGGIGRAISLHLASLGAKILINYSSNSDASQINTNTTDSPRAITFQADVSDPAQVKSFFDAAESAFHSQPHILVNSAGVIDPKYPTLFNTEIDDFDKILRVNASRLGEPGDVAPVVGFLASDASEWINVQVVRVNGGYI